MKPFKTIFDHDFLKGGEGSGNFAHAGRPGEVGGSGPSNISVEPSRRVNADMKATAKAWGGTRAEYAANALYNIKDVGYKGIIAKNESGELVGVADYHTRASSTDFIKSLARERGIRVLYEGELTPEEERQPIGVTYKEYFEFTENSGAGIVFEVGYMATAPESHGTGREMFKQLANEIVKYAGKKELNKASLYLVATGDAVGFWKKMGMSVVGQAGKSKMNPDFGTVPDGHYEMWISYQDLKKIALSKGIEPDSGVYSIRISNSLSF